MDYEKGMKTVEDSLTEMTKILQYEDINGENRLFGGRLMSWIDEIATITAMRHCGGSVTTCAVDNLTFKRGAFLNDIILLKGHVTHVGRTSMEVRVDTYTEDRASGMRRLINHAYLVLVSIGEDGSPKEIPYGLALQNEMQQAEWDRACRRLEIRKQRRSEGF